MVDTIKKLTDTIDDLLNADIDAIDWAHKPSSEKWSKKQIIGHLIDSAQINLQRFVRCTYEENFKLTYEQVEWVEAQHYQAANVNELLGLWKLLNLQIVRVLANYPAERLQAQCDNNKTTASLHSVEWLAADYVVHMRHHLKQVIKS
ncbi:DinB family protein [Mucilaginibacter sp. OK098]|uniref:DinB family protein n=1 Tax=Mucilaginibacter sp. OK098 TaxID=1855297 RepID=UPI000910DAC2|nr:DinB family protein [Mucilaginibacter sp. OK098]SHM00461.1 DinB superfamily protein [Mucilaginibacter sp. OK098]